MSYLESSSSSSSDAEELERCREAAMPAWGLEQRPRGLEKQKAGAANTQLPTTQPSLRHKVDEHEQDGNELQTTPEFRAHVAKKLGALLDSSITISEVVKEPRKAEVRRGTPEDDGFRLFFTSIPGASEKEAAPQPRRKRLPSSSSEDGDEELQRCREAAVSASDILQESAIHGPVSVEEKAKKKKRKLKKKAKKEASADVAAAATITTTGKAAVGKQSKESAELNGAQAPLGTKKKKRKKKAKRAGEAAPSPPAKSAAATPVHRVPPVGTGPN
ncbi:protein CUSTOS isoform X2 [Phacochoerus africanus]|uniref:protein CUSTOS isoform X2 n=1 Tax=Phacochoerus africanus TaxID=41426 RepID=UPI001FDA7FD9|nr:protein CUSTOS isoform X2 [Phacochoerus africanus]